MEMCKTGNNPATCERRAANPPRRLARSRTVATAKPQETAADGIYPAVTPPLAQSERAAERSFEKLYQRHVHAVYRYSLAVLHNEADAEDVTQTTFLSAYRAFQRGERPYRPHNWLIKIAHNVCRQRFRDSSRRPQEVEFDESLAAATTQRRRRPDRRRDPPRPRLPRLQPARRARHARARGTLVRRDRPDPRPLRRCRRDPALPRPPRAPRAARGRAHVRGGRAHALAPRRAAAVELRARALRAHLRECKDCAILERRQRAQRAALKNLGAVPLPASLAGSFFGGGAVGGGVAVGGMGIGAKIATVLAAGVVATGVGREAVQAVQASDTSSSPKKPAAVVDNPAFSPVSRDHQRPSRREPDRHSAEDEAPGQGTGNRFSGASKSLHGIAAGRSQQGAPTGGNRGRSRLEARPAAGPQVQLPRIQVPAAAETAGPGAADPSAADPGAARSRCRRCRCRRSLLPPPPPLPQDPVAAHRKNRGTRHLR